MSFWQIVSFNIGWLVIATTGTMELLTRKRMGSVTVWLVIGSSFTAGVVSIVNLWNIWLGIIQLTIFLISYIKRDTLIK